MSHLGYLRGRPRVLTSSRLRPPLRRGSSLADVALVGARTAGPIRLIVASDVSGSMVEFADAREAALLDLVTWAHRNLRPHDELGFLHFAEESVWVHRPAALERFDAVDTVPPVDLTGGGTLLGPVLEAVANVAPGRGVTGLWLLSDGWYPDYPGSSSAGARLLLRAGVGEASLLIPTDAVAVPKEWTLAFPDAFCAGFDGRNRRQTALALGLAAASLTGQRLVSAANRTTYASGSQ